MLQKALYSAEGLEVDFRLLVRPVQAKSSDYPAGDVVKLILYYVRELEQNAQ